MMIIIIIISSSLLLGVQAQIFSPTFAIWSLGFLPDRNQTSLRQFSGLFMLIMIKKVEFCHLVCLNRVISKRGVTKFTQKPINPKRKLRTLGVQA